ncbi:glutathione S-transferase family protein [Ramlibacter humi]|uniref:Glutathione S-transferase family protein n=1 Tax=Ramlibacter humi TaxID=2530451 RepID=A0A4Z0BBS5_9BURK|nr:glutathione S-transferase family protein [Ramlibacter humi]TFY96626.1 glutathione S-transferase family protein [Ramlibacter humi]
MIELHYYPSTAAMVPHILLEEIGVPYRRVLVDRAVDAHKRPEYLRLNPNGLLPVLADGDLVLYETAAITLHLADHHPQARLAPALGSTARSHFYKWLMWLTNTLQATLILYFYPERWVDEGHEAAAKEIQRHARAKATALLQQVEKELVRNAGPWFMGEHYTALDAYLFTLCRWTRNFPEGRARDRERLGAYLQRMLDRPAVQRVLAAEGLKPPYV